MKTVFDVPAGRLIPAAAEKLKALPEMRPPAWVGFVKSGAHAERAPDQPDFWYLRAASILRQVYVNGPVGVSVFRRHYGGKKKHRVRREHRAIAGGNIIRKALQALDKAGLTEKKREGRVASAKGKALLNGVAKAL
ncbi:MAG: 30S ribosomal protein S19e [Candidatus ainarchaeum sp.]|nr:30S ribosomal protein S19e [Candidatus ainarchaeum sp.]